jgi:EAL domain-containing protein (putative c-di-GMP-specific phosphodiesterase class I)
VETSGEADACKGIGFELLQGFYFGRPLQRTASFAEAGVPASRQ